MGRSIALAAVLAVAAAAPAMAQEQEPLIVVEDPTGVFGGSYVESEDDPATEEDEYSEGYQQGYVAVYEDGVVACNGNPQPLPYDQNGDGTDDPVQGYLWVGRNHQASGDIWPFQAGAGLAGGGSNHGKYSHEPTGESPCPEADPEGDGPDQ